MMCPDDLAPGQANGNFKSQAARWLFSQGASTVLLFAILAVIGYGGPKLYEGYTRSQKEARDDFKATLKEQRDEASLQGAQARQQYTESLRELKEGFTRSIDKLGERMDGRK